MYLIKYVFNHHVVFASSVKTNSKSILDHVGHPYTGLGTFKEIKFYKILAAFEEKYTHNDME